MMRTLSRRLLFSAAWEFTIHICKYVKKNLIKLYDNYINRLETNEFPIKINFIFIFNLFRYEKAVIAMAKQSVTLEVLSYHASASLEDAQRLRVGSILLTLKYSRKDKKKF